MAFASCLFYCLGKRERALPCHHQGILPIDRFQAEEILNDIDAGAPSADSGELTFAPTTVSSKRLGRTLDG